MARSDPRPNPLLPFPDGNPGAAEARGAGEHVPAAALLAHVSDLVAVIDARGEIVAVSGSVATRLGHEPAQLIGAPVSRLFVADHAEVPAEVLDRVFLEPGAHGPIQLLAVAADGHVRRVEATIDNHLEGIVDLTGNASSGAVVVTAIDLTERQMIDASLTEQRSLLESIARGAALDATALRLVERLERWIPDAAAVVLVPGPDGTLSAVASPTAPEGFAAALDRPGADSPVIAALSASPVEVSLATPRDAQWFPIRSACRAAGVEALWVRPLHLPDAHTPIGAVLVARPDMRAPSELELDLVEQTAHLASISIERQTALAALQHAAVHDDLTGLPNRTLLLDRIGQALARASRTQLKVGVLFVDLDRFKHINDTLGHATGDAVLKAVAERLQGVLRSGDTVGRLGGDEFLMVCTEIEDDAAALAVGQRVADALVEPVRCGGASLRIRASIGVALADDGADEPENVIRDADHAMYRAKDRGRDGVVLFERADHLRVLTRVDIEQALHGAQERGELVLHYQPVVRLVDRRQTGVEALVRWERPGEGLLHPGTFIDIAEDSGLIVPLGSWVIEEAFRSAAAWPPTRGGRIQVAVNLSPRQLSAPGLLDLVTALFDRTGVEPSSICFEVTELALVRDEDLAVDTLERLKGLGVHIAIDDFGTGHATLDYLRRFSMADVLKIDRSFVQGLEEVGGQEQAIVGASVALAHSLGISVVAEGVETEAQLEAVLALDCDMAQGYLLGAPERFVNAVATSTASR